MVDKRCRQLEKVCLQPVETRLQPMEAGFTLMICNSDSLHLTKACV